MDAGSDRGEWCRDDPIPMASSEDDFMSFLAWFFKVHYCNSCDEQRPPGVFEEEKEGSTMAGGLSS